MGLEEDFLAAVEKVNNFKKKPSDDDLLIVYGLYKQATVGDVNTSRPGLFDPKGKAKWDAWKKNEGKSKDLAKQEYITKATQLAEDCSTA
ncbi:Acyl CoA Binding Protein [Klebsormidium nitens]|uniref:Acyl CoA Binding Protein n=1 Tax=Klebsormidium nitens TaxID=105231 RepID=A0A1Y1IV17_KLENI|nr:Acyl CoA Binding Protein [Klebsormidium nitens]|eukprot:GAQ93221.1 Acyl CoA Binding Protein [Klebsormidium nitens]